MLHSKLGCALEPNISLLSYFVNCHRPQLSQTFGAWGNLGRVKYYLCIVRYLPKQTAMLQLG